ncbi:hypothetical protein PIB30_061210 [Stylosanthes scabra]|uniref:Uncharacterized protein n=1 Tax=Stylosanthes scabra TaxID=79078 RepID=A0ABU6YJM4_9FABA|nr:hypothetical protein [Stylosanthes scabra]
MELLEFSSEDEVEGELIFLQYRFLQNAIARKKFTDNLISNIAKSLPQEIDAAHQQRPPHHTCGIELDGWTWPISFALYSPLHTWCSLLEIIVHRILILAFKVSQVTKCKTNDNMKLEDSRIF